MIFVLAAGEVLVSRAGKALETLVPGNCFGEILYFLDGSARRTTTISATAPVVLLEVKARSLARASPECQVQFSQAFLQIFMYRIERLQQRLVDVAAGAI